MNTIIWVLVFVSYSGSNSGARVHTQEFYSAKQCQIAGEFLKAETQKQWRQFQYQCIQK